MKKLSELKKGKDLTAEQIRNLSPDRLRLMRKEGMSPEKIAVKTGVSKCTISKRLKEYKIK